MRMTKVMKRHLPNAASTLFAAFLAVLFAFCLGAPQPAWAAKRNSARNAEKAAQKTVEEARKKALAPAPAKRTETRTATRAENGEAESWQAPMAVREDDFTFGRDPFQVSPQLRSGRGGASAAADDGIRLRARMGNLVDLEIGKERYVARHGELIHLSGDAAYRVEVGTDSVRLKALSHSRQDVVVR